MDIAKLNAFIVVAEQLNFRKSAEILGMSQPPLTRLIAGLEKELGVSLFERTTRSVRLTGAGVLLLHEAREIAAAFKRIETDVRGLGKIKAGHLKIGFSRTAFMARFPELIQEFQERFPKIKLDLRENSSKDILRLVQEGVYDVGFVESVSTTTNLSHAQVMSENLGVLLSIKNPLSKRKDLHFSELKNETIILHSREEAEEFHDRIVHLIRGLKQKPKIYIKGPEESCPILVATGKGISLTICGANHHNPKLTRFVPINDMFLPVSVFWDEKNQNPYLKSFVGFALEKKSLLSPQTQCLVL